ncbi:MAG: molybdopterin-dependent oxidoreductase [Kiloniellaceae bacterium]
MFVRMTRLAFALAALALLTRPGTAGELANPDGPVVLTVSGNIAQTNRAPFDPVRDAFLKYHEKAFEKAAEFDHAMLEALGMHEVKLASKNWPGAPRFEGPMLKDVLAAAGAAGKTVTVYALDGYGAKITKDELEGRQWILAIKRDGEYLKLGQRGPTLLAAPHKGKVTSKSDESKWVWSAFYIEVE